MQRSTFLYDVLKRTNSALGKTEEEFYRAISFKFYALSAIMLMLFIHIIPQKTDVNKLCLYE